MRIGLSVRVAAAALLLLATWAARLAPGPGFRLLPARALAGEAWRAEFDEVCSKTQDAMALSTEELRGLVARCDALKPRIEALDEPRRKVFGRRLQGCRDLYQFVIDFRTKAGP